MAKTWVKKVGSWNFHITRERNEVTQTCWTYQTLRQILLHAHMFHPKRSTMNFSVNYYRESRLHACAQFPQIFLFPLSALLRALSWTHFPDFIFPPTSRTYTFSIVDRKNRKFCKKLQMSRRLWILVQSIEWNRRSAEMQRSGIRRFFGPFWGHI